MLLKMWRRGNKRENQYATPDLIFPEHMPFETFSVYIVLFTLLNNFTYYNFHQVGEGIFYISYHLYNHYLVISRTQLTQIPTLRETEKDFFKPTQSHIK